MAYQRLEVNLLPPEMAPPPPVRLAWVVNAFFIVGGLAYILGHLTITMMAIGDKKAEVAEKDNVLNQQKPKLAEYEALEEIRVNTEGRGKLVGMASSTYVEYPIVLERISRIVPPGVFLVKASSTGAKGANEITMQFRASRNDPVLMSATLEAFKLSPMFRDAYMRVANQAQVSLEELTNTFDIPYGYNNNDSDVELVNNEFDFEIRTKVNSPLEPDDLILVADRSDLIIPFNVTTNPAAATRGSSRKAPQAEGAQAEEGEAPAAGAAGGNAPASPPAGGAPPANAAAGGGQ